MFSVPDKRIVLFDSDMVIVMMLRCGLVNLADGRTDELVAVVVTAVTVVAVGTVVVVMLMVVAVVKMVVAVVKMVVAVVMVVVVVTAVVM